MGHQHGFITNKKALFWAILINILLTIAQVVGGLMSGSLSLLADALHNFSDAGSLIIAYIAEKISGLPADEKMTFGYGRAQILGALINSVTLVIVAMYLFYEAFERFRSPQEIDGWMVIGIACVALVIDTLTAWLTHTGSKESVNMKAAFVHNVSDALASIVVIISGALILLYKSYWVDLVATIVISVYILYQSLGLIKNSIKILMQAVPEDLRRSDVSARIKKIDGVYDLHHIHIWQIYEKFRSLEAHIVVKEPSFEKVEKLKASIREVLNKDFKINHSTLEFESLEFNCQVKKVGDKHKQESHE